MEYISLMQPSYRFTNRYWNSTYLENFEVIEHVLLYLSLDIEKRFFQQWILLFYIHVSGPIN